MIAIRRRIRAVAFAWLLCQVASLSAFVPEQCCESHAAQEAAKAKAAECHEEAPPAPKEGDACPMHHESKSHDCCKIGGVCDGPGAQLLTLFANVGMLESPAATPLTPEFSTTALAPAPPLLHRRALPDAPPPKN